jgi:hypothetical protein
LGFIEEALMPKWNVSFTDDDGQIKVVQFDCEHEPSLEEAAHLLRNRVAPALKELDLNDLEGRTEKPTVKSLKDLNSIEILTVTKDA